MFLSLRERHPEWESGTAIGIAYDLKSLLYTSRPLPLSGANERGEAYLSELVSVKNLDGTESKKRYRMALTLVSEIPFPGHSPNEWARLDDQRVLGSLETSMLTFARMGASQDSPEWFLVGSKAFRSIGESFPLSTAYSARRGYYAGLKTCLAGLVFVSDMAVSCFLNGGEMINVMWHTGGYRLVRITTIDTYF